jgi:hypothetical protein
MAQNAEEMLRERRAFHIDDLENDIRGLFIALELGHYEAIRRIASGMTWSLDKLRELNG